MPPKRKASEDNDPVEAPVAGKPADELLNPAKRAKPIKEDVPPPDKKKSNVVTDDKLDAKRVEGSALDSLAIVLAGSPRQKRIRTIVQIPLESVQVFSSRYYSYAVRFIDPYQAMRIPVSESEFVKCVAYLLNCRLHDVAGKATGHRYAGRTVAGSVFQLPTPIAQMINDVGTFQSIGLGTLFVPAPPNPPADQNAAIGRIVGHDMLSRFSQFVGQLADRGLCSLCPMSRETEGTAYWLCHVTIANGDVPDANSDRVVVHTALHETTPRDFLQASLTLFQRGATFFAHPATFESAVISDPQAICTTYFTSR